MLGVYYSILHCKCEQDDRATQKEVIQHSEKNY